MLAINLFVRENSSSMTGWAIEAMNLLDSIIVISNEMPASMTKFSKLVK